MNQPPRSSAIGRSARTRIALSIWERAGGEGVTRRAFLRDLARLGGAAAGLGLLAACAPAPQPARGSRVYRVGRIDSRQPDEVATAPIFWERMRELGYIEGGNLVREERIATGDDLTAQYNDLGAELARLPVDVLVVTGAPIRRAAIAATASIPIVMMGGGGDVVEQGFVESLARPGRNVTGVVGAPPEIELKRLQLLVEAAPGISRVAVLGGGVLPLSEDAWEAAARSLGVDLLRLSVVSRADYEIAFERAVAQGADSLLVVTGGQNNSNRDLIVSLAERHRLPGIYSTRDWATSGGLMMYAARRAETERRAADYVDRILRGTRPADLPVELPSRYDLIVNLRAARALGLTFPPAFLAQVDEVIE